jgi:hypothetical protein
MAGDALPAAAQVLPRARREPDATGYEALG